MRIRLLQPDGDGRLPAVSRWPRVQHMVNAYAMRNGIILTTRVNVN